MDKYLDISKGSLTIVGTGISISGQITQVAKKHIQLADVVFAAIPNAPGLEYIKSLNPNTFSLTDLYEVGKKRALTYDQMVSRIVKQVQDGKKVCAAFYGHPGVFVSPSHIAIDELKIQGYLVQMEPGISAEDCLIADLGLDPAKYGLQSYEATKFLLRNYSIDPYMTQVIWQVALAGDYSFTSKLEYDGVGLKLLQTKLEKSFPGEHEVIIYEARDNPLFSSRIERMSLSELSQATLTPISTLVVPSLGIPDFDDTVFTSLGITPELVERNSKLNS